MNRRINELRKTLGLTMDKFGDRLGVKKNTISQWESGVNNITEPMIKSICNAFNVEELWLKTGDGPMFCEPLEDETAAIVSDLLEDGRNNPFYEIILEIMNTYNGLSPKSQEVLRDASSRLLENLQKKKGD